MWIMVLFDLPVGTMAERKAATSFRNYLLDEGSEMAQFSVYTRFTSGKEQAEAYTRRLESRLPPYGKVHVLYFTDKQYENMKCFHGRLAKTDHKNPDQYVLF